MSGWTFFLSLFGTLVVWLASDFALSFVFEWTFFKPLWRLVFGNTFGDEECSARPKEDFRRTLDD